MTIINGYKFKLFDGTWENDLFIKGKVIYKNGNEFVGTWKTGKGKMLYENNSSYKGQWLNHKRHGHGTMITKGFIYEGSWRYGKKHGIVGVYKITDED